MILIAPLNKRHKLNEPNTQLPGDLLVGNQKITEFVFFIHFIDTVDNDCDENIPTVSQSCPFTRADTLAWTCRFDAILLIRWHLQTRKQKIKASGISCHLHIQMMLHSLLEAKSLNIGHVDFVSAVRNQCVASFATFTARLWIAESLNEIKLNN
jgi:hypothetical protein